MLNNWLRRKEGNVSPLFYLDHLLILFLGIRAKQVKIVVSQAEFCYILSLK